MVEHKGSMHHSRDPLNSHIRIRPFRTSRQKHYIYLNICYIIFYSTYQKGVPFEIYQISHIMEELNHLPANKKIQTCGLVKNINYIQNSTIQ